MTAAELVAIEREFPEYKVQVELFTVAAHARFVNAQAQGPVRERSGEMCAVTRMREIYNFWRRMDRESRIPNIRKLAQLVFTLTPSSAAAERSFSMLMNLFDLQQLQGGTLSDYVQAAVMARFRTGNLENEFH